MTDARFESFVFSPALWAYGHSGWFGRLRIHHVGVINLYTEDDWTWYANFQPPRRP